MGHHVPSEVVGPAELLAADVALHRFVPVDLHVLLEPVHVRVVLLADLALEVLLPVAHEPWLAGFCCGDFFIWMFATMNRVFQRNFVGIF